MEPKLNVKIVTTMLNNQCTSRRFVGINLNVEKETDPKRKKKVWSLVIGRTQKIKIQITGNIKQIHQTFLRDGKITVAFYKPPTECHMQLFKLYDSQILLLELLIRALKKTNNGHDFDVKTFKTVPHDPSVLALRAKFNHLGTKLKLPSNFFTLMCLDLTGQNLVTLPIEIGDLLLNEIKLNNNRLGDGPRYWSWLYGPIRKSLVDLSLDYNKLNRLPDQIIACKALRRISLNGNDLHYLPPSLFSSLTSRIEEIQVIDNVNLYAWPDQQVTLSFMNLSGCNKLTDPRTYSKQWNYSIQLKELAARVILNKRIPYGPYNLPRELTEYLNGGVFCGGCRQQAPVPFYTEHILREHRASQCIRTFQQFYCVRNLCNKCAPRLRQIR